MTAEEMKIIMDLACEASARVMQFRCAEVCRERAERWANAGPSGGEAIACAEAITSLEV